MVALARYRAELHVCGHLLSDSAAGDAEGRYVADLPFECHACTAIAIKQAEYRKDHPHSASLVWSAQRR